MSFHAPSSASPTSQTLENHTLLSGGALQPLHSWLSFLKSNALKTASHVNAFLSLEYHQLFLLIPVFIGFGILGFFSFPILSLSLLMRTVIFLCMVGFFTAAFLTNTLLIRCVCLAVALFLLGFGAAFWRTSSLKTPLLNRTHGPCVVEGIVEELHPLHTQRMRLMLRLTKPLPPTKRCPNPPPLKRVRLYLLPDKKEVPQDIPLPQQNDKGADTQNAHVSTSPLAIGQRVQIWAKLHKIPPPTWPRGYDFRRAAFFEGWGARGFALAPVKVLPLEKPQKHKHTHRKGARHTLQKAFAIAHQRWAEFIELKRTQLEALFYEHLQKESPSLASALLCGKKSGLSPFVRDVFARAGIAHLLAISGLHMSIVAGLVFFLLQGLLALFPPLVLRISPHKIAALLTLLMTFVYLQLSGSFTPATRAFLMTSCVMVGLLMDRQALTLRLVAIAATFLLLFRPENLLSASFQLSFAAVTSLVAGLEFLRKRALRSERLGGEGIGGRLLKNISGVMLSTLVAGLATTPYTLYHFQQFTFMGTLANLVAIPLTTFVIMPLGLLFCAFVPLGLSWPLSFLLDRALDVLLRLAVYVSAWPLSALSIPAAHPFWLWPLTLGGLWFFTFQSKVRFWGLGVFVFGFCGLFIPHPPSLFMDGEAKVLAYFEASTKTLWTTSLRRAAFAQHTWMKATGATHQRLLPLQHHTYRIQRASLKQSKKNLKNTVKRLSHKAPQAVFASKDVRQENLRAPQEDIIRSPFRCTRTWCMARTDSKHTLLISLDGRESAFCGLADIALSLEPFKWRCGGRKLSLDFFSAWRYGSWAVYLHPQSSHFLKTLWARLRGKEPSPQTIEAFYSGLWPHQKGGLKG